MVGEQRVHSSAPWLLSKGVGVVCGFVSKFCHLVIAEVVIADCGVIALMEFGPLKGLQRRSFLQSLYLSSLFPVMGPSFHIVLHLMI